MATAGAATTPIAIASMFENLSATKAHRTYIPAMSLITVTSDRSARRGARAPSSARKGKDSRVPAHPRARCAC